MLTLAKHSETGEDMVIYQDVVHPEKVWVRPVTMWMEKLIIDGEEKERFQFIS